MTKSTDEISRKRSVTQSRQLGLPIDQSVREPDAAPRTSPVTRIRPSQMPPVASPRSIVEAEVDPVPIVMLRLLDVCRITGLCRSAIYQLESEQRFPQRVNIGPRAVAWVASEVQEWLKQRMASRPALPQRAVGGGRF
jgi:prophage regulatory protein